MKMLYPLKLYKHPQILLGKYSNENEALAPLFRLELVHRSILQFDKESTYQYH